MCNEMRQSQGYITRGIITGQMGRRGTILDRIHVNPYVLLASFGTMALSTITSKNAHSL